MWYHIVPQTTGFYWKEPRTSISTFNTYDLEVLQEAKEPSSVDKELPPFEESKEEASDHSDSSDDNEENKDTAQIRNSPIVTAPPPYTFLPPITMASTSTTTRIQTATQGSPPGSPVAPAPNPSTRDQIAAIFHQNFGPFGGNPGGGGRGGEGGQPQLQPQQQQNVLPAAGVRTMGKLPEIFDRDRTKAEDFIEEVKGYLHLNQDVAGFNSPMKKVHFTLTHMKGPKVANWVNTMGETIKSMDPAVNNIPKVWTQFLDTFDAQFQDSTKEEKARTQLKNLRMKGNLIDEYVSDFEELVRMAGYATESPETMAMFLDGVDTGILRDIIKPPIPRDYRMLQQKAIESTKAQQAINDILKSRGQGRVNRDFHSDHHNSSNSNNKDNGNSLEEPIEVIGMATSSTQAMPLEATITPPYLWTLIAEEWTTEEKDHSEDES